MRTIEEQLRESFEIFMRGFPEKHKEYYKMIKKYIEDKKKMEGITMTTIKSYTDISQSKKLAKFLPLESADMWYHGHYSPWKSERKYDDEPCSFHSMFPNWDEPCWSLAALLSVLDFPSLTQNKEDEWEVCVFGHDNDDYIEKTASNPVDACVDMIERLHALKML